LGLLGGLGLGPQEEDVYRLLLINHGLSMADLVMTSGLPPEQARGAVDRLIELNLVHDTTADSADSVLQPVDPRDGLQSLLSDQLAELHIRQREYEENRATISKLLVEFNDLYPAQGNQDGERLIGVDAIRTRIKALAMSSTTECMTFNPGGAHSAASLEASKPLDRDLIARGVHMRTVYLDSVRNDGTTSEYAHWLTELGSQVRTVPVLPVRMVLVDRKVALVPVDAYNSRKGAVQLRSPGVIAALVDLFERVWAQAVPFGAPPQKRHDNGLTPREQELLKLLAQGLTDAAAGKSLGLSLRTVRRMTADLSERLNARSRFEAGLRAGQRGWL
jgi:DNA-binding CsgD family transcriptional regulator/sugar-specific transcriptional regulator TrmB